MEERRDDGMGSSRTRIVCSSCLLLPRRVSVDDRLLLSSHIPDEYLFRNTLVVSATPGVEGKPWSVQYVWTDDKWASGKKTTAEAAEDAFTVPVASAKGFKATLRLKPSNLE
jgi:hypothetical protein